MMSLPFSIMTFSSVPVVCSNSPFLKRMSASQEKLLWYISFSLPKTSEVHLLSPDIGIEALAPIFIEHEGVGMIDNGAESVVDKVPSNEKAQSKSNQGYDGDPFLPWVLGCLPWMVDFTFLHPSRTEVFLVLLLVMDVDSRGILGSAQGC